MRRKTGTKEWAEVNKNIQRGCKHNCIYCYARHNALRFKQIHDKDEWENMILLDGKLNEQPHDLHGKRIMFPTTHDIFPEYIDETIKYLKGWLSHGNEMLIVSKPHLECIKKICDQLGEYKKLIVFRFTIGSNNDRVLKFWEPNAPSFSERFDSLQYAFNKGFTTSVSCEPFLDGNIVQLVTFLSLFVSDTIWIGKMNRIRERVNMKEWSEYDKGFLTMVMTFQTNQNIKNVYDDLKNNPKVRWKDSIKNVLNLPEEAVG